MNIQKQCDWCGNKYRTGNGKAKYCSDKCRKEAHKQKQKDWREKHPGYLKRWHEEHPEYNKEWLEEHDNYYRDRSRRIRNSKERVSKCVICGTEFSTYHKRATTCSKECSKKEHERRIDKLKANGVFDKDISLEKLITRDDGVCYICGKPINRNDYAVINGIKVCGNEYPSIDHVVPVSKGGTHMWSNVRLTHRRCNSIKGER